MTYSKSFALEQWLTTRRASIDRIDKAHSDLGEVEGPGRPLELGKPLAHSYIIRVVAEFQAFTRDLYDLAAEHLITVAEPPAGLVAILTSAVTSGRSMDAGNATMKALRTDFSRLGIRRLDLKLAAKYSTWDVSSGGKDTSRFNHLIEMRNALAHGNQRQVDEYRRQGRSDTVTWGRAQLPALNRAARGLDTIVWEHLLNETGAAPW